MGKTNALRKQVTSLLKKVCKNCFYEHAIDKELYPHIVFSFATTDNSDTHMDKIYMDVDIWCKGDGAAEVEGLADDVEKIFRCLNNPEDEILPTYYTVDRRIVEDPDKTIRRRMIKVEIQNYEREE